MDTAIAAVRSRYGAKLGLGYTATGTFIVAVGLVTNDVNSTIVAAVAGLLTLGSVNAAETVASVTEISAQTAGRTGRYRQRGRFHPDRRVRPAG